MSFPLGPIQDADGRLRDDFAELSRLWREVRESWRDEQARRFEAEHLAELGPSLSRLAQSLAEFGEAVRRADRLLEEPEANPEGEGGGG